MSSKSMKAANPRVTGPASGNAVDAFRRADFQIGAHVFKSARRLPAIVRKLTSTASSTTPKAIFAA